jgi:predicted amidohydrolase
MSVVKIALANLPFPETPEDSVRLAVESILEAGKRGADIVCFPECYVPGYRLLSRTVAPPDRSFLEAAWARVEKAAANAHVAVILGTERFEGDALRITTLVIDRDGSRLGLHDKTQLDPSEESTFEAGTERHVYRTGALTTFADPANTFHEKAILCRAAENTCFVASVNYASEGSPTTSAIARPDGTLLAWQPYGQPGLLVADLDLAEATRLLAMRLLAAAGAVTPLG